VAGWSAVKTIAGVEPWYIGAIFGLFLLGATTTKDFADMEGDRRGGCRTLPIEYGVRRAAWMISPSFVVPFAMIAAGAWLRVLTGNFWLLQLLGAVMTGYGLYVCYLIVQPFVPAITIAVAAAVATRRPQLWLRGRLHSRTAAAAVGVLLVAGLIVVPLSLLITYLVRQIVESIHELQAGGGLSEWRSIVHLPAPVSRALDWVQANLDLQSQLTEIGQSLASQAGNVLAGSVNLLTQLVIMLFVLFFLYRDRESALHALRHLVPLSDREAYDIGARIENTILAIVNGSLTVALVSIHSFCWFCCQPASPRMFSLPAW